MSLAILGLGVLGGQHQVRAASPVSDWPSLSADAAQSNSNPVEKIISAKSVLKLRVRWVVPIPDVSYPIVAGGRVYLPTLAGKGVHARALDAATGKPVAKFGKGAVGGLLVAGGNLYLAGRSLEVLDPASGDKLGEVKGNSPSKGATFTYPLADRKLVVSGFASESHSVPNSLYAIDPSSSRVLWHIPSLNAQGAVANGRIITLTAAGSAFYNENTGKQLALQRAFFSDWFAGDTLAYTVASVNGHKATLYAYNASGKKVWSKVVGPAIDAYGWAHAVTADGLYVATVTPHEGVEALDPLTGSVLWRQALPGVQRIAVANKVVIVLQAGMAQPLRLAFLHAGSGKPIGGLTISGGYFAFPAQNELMIANGMIFLRAVGPNNTTQLLALGK